MPLGFLDHLSELRSVLLKCFLFMAIGFVCSWFFSEEILNFIRQPLLPFLESTDGKLIFTSPIEKFASYVKISLFSGIAFSCPFWLYQIWKFVSPGLHKDEKTLGFLFVFLGTLLFFLGGAFVYFVVYPLAFEFLFRFGSDGEVAYISLKEYLSFFIRSSLVFALVFEVPLFLVSLMKLKLFDVQWLIRSRRIAIVIIAATSACITPPDVISMFFVMIPLYLLFELSILVGSCLD